MITCLYNFSELIQGLGALATVGTFIYLIIDRNKQQEQINELAKLALTSERRIRLQFKPRIWSNGGGYHGSERTLEIRLENRGPIAYLQSIRPISGDTVWLNTWQNEVQLTRDGHVTIQGRYAGEKAMNDVAFIVEILLRDEEHYKYRLELRWTGAGGGRIINEQEL
jgi:hypothetical protein